MTDLDFITPREALQAMLDAGAIFSTQHRDDGLSGGTSFTYEMANGGDRAVCRQILAEVKSKPPQFFAAFRCAVQDLVASIERGEA